MAERYRRLVFELEAGDPESLAAALWELGTLGLELPEAAAEGAVVAYFAEGAHPGRVEWSVYGARLARSEVVEKSDWMALYRAQSRPLPIGARLVVDPREPESSGRGSDDWPGRHLLRLPARTAFGTGSHPSTRLVVELMDELDLEGKRVLDVGFGSGILSFAAALFGASQVVGVEIDVESALVAGQNRGLNGIHPSWIAGGVAALAPIAGFDAALVNVLPERVAGDLERIRRLLEPDGFAIFSGIPVERERRVRERLVATGFRPGRRLDHGEWLALVAER